MKYDLEKLKCKLFEPKRKPNFKASESHEKTRFVEPAVRPKYGHLGNDVTIIGDLIIVNRR